MVYFGSKEEVFHTTCLELKEVNFSNFEENKTIVPKVEFWNDKFNGLYGFQTMMYNSWFLNNSTFLVSNFSEGHEVVTSINIETN